MGRGWDPQRGELKQSFLQTTQTLRVGGSSCLVTPLVSRERDTKRMLFEKMAQTRGSRGPAPILQDCKTHSVLEESH